LCAGDFVALGIMNAARKQGMNVPQELGITGFANEIFTEFTTPSITTVHQKGIEVGRSAAELYLRSAMSNQKEQITENIVIPAELIFRESSRRKL